MARMTTTVAYHADGFRPARPAINVKLHIAGLDFWPAEFLRLTEQADDMATGERYGEYVEAAYDRVQSDFWQAATENADQYGLGAIEQEGRSGGWLAFTDGRSPQECAEHPAYEDRPDLAPGDLCDDMREWLDAYTRYAAWVQAELTAIPGRVARLAQDMAMDELGAAAVNRVVLP